MSPLQEELLSSQNINTSNSLISRTRWTNYAGIVAMVLLASCWPSSSAKSCSNGIEFECEKRIGDGRTCVQGCNVTIAAVLSPADCQGNCCKICYTDCEQCVYTKIIVFTITSMAWKDNFLDHRTEAYANISLQIQIAFQSVFQNRNISRSRSELLMASGKTNDVTVFVKLISHNQKQEDLAITALRNASMVGSLGGLILSLDSFEAITEAEFYQRTKKKEISKSNFDLVETIVTCIAALIIGSAVGVCLFFYCTTPTQRRLCCGCYKFCMNRVE